MSMEIITYETKTFAGKEVFVRRFKGGLFEYMVIMNGAIYTNHIIVKPKLYRRVLRFFRFIKDVYSPQEIGSTKQYLEVMAAQAIEKVLGLSPKQMAEIIDKQ